MLFGIGLLYKVIDIMSKRIELIKSIALILLILLSIVLFANSWVREWSYSDSENDTLLRRLVSSVGFGDFFGYASQPPSGTDIIAPSTVILTSGTKRVILNKGTEGYADNYSDILSVLLCAENPDGAVKSVSAEEWFSAQKTQAIYLNYGMNIKRQVLETTLGCSLPSELGSISSIVLTSNSSATNKLVIYFRDGVADSFYKLLTRDSARSVEDILSRNKGYSNTPLAVELGFNSSPEEGISQQIVIDGNAVINLEGGYVPQVTLIPVENASDLLDNRSLNSLLALFGMSKSSASRYADSDGTSTYIDTYGSLSFHNIEDFPVIEYTAAASSKGKELNNTKTDIMYNMAYNSYTQVYSVAELFGINGVSFKIASDITTASISSQGETTIYIDYCANGIPLYLNSGEEVGHAAELRFNSSGELIYYKQNLFDVQQTDARINIPPVLDAINSLDPTDKIFGNVLYIKDIFGSYSIKDGEARFLWSIRIDGDDKIYSAE